MIVKLLFLSAVVFFIVGCRANSSDTAERPPVAASFKGALIPLYSQPSDPAWTSLLEANITLETIAIINPNSGPLECNTTMSYEYREGINQLKSHSVKVIGYVYSKYGARPIEEVKADISRYKECYSNLDGIFVDEVNASSQSAFYYQELRSFIKEGNVSQKMVLNPGIYPDEEIAQASDITIIYENEGDGYDVIVSPAYASKYSSSKFALIGYGIAPSAVSEEKLKRLSSMNVGYVYLTEDGANGENPWDTLSSYYGSLMELLSFTFL